MGKFSCTTTHLKHVTRCVIDVSVGLYQGLAGVGLALVLNYFYKLT